jgi:predicted DsbA family dithiol-disulfide isomerase/uncharacterized membrane protein
VRKTLAFWVVIALCVVALVASSLLLVDYVRPSPVFCAAEGGCGVVKRTVFAYPLGIPTPLLGIGGFLAVGLAALVPGRRARLAQLALAAVGGLVALGLIVVQAVLHTLCPYCIVVDVSALVLLGFSTGRVLAMWDPPQARAQLGAGVGAVCLAVAVPVAIGMTRKPIPSTVPAAIAEEMRKTPRGKVTVIDFVDFECPFCRMTHAELGPLLAARKDKVRVARKHVPLRMHAHASDAARAAACAETMGKGDEVAESLFTANPGDLTREGCEKIAETHGLDVARFRACMTSPETEARIKADGEAFRAAQGHGLPTLFIDGTKLEGAQDPAVLESTLDTAIRAH